MRAFIRSSLFTIVAQRSWQAFSGVITTILVTLYLTPVELGWYYSFLSVGAIYTVFDLGLSTVIIQKAAYFSLKSHSGEENPVFADFSRSVKKYYLLIGIVFFVVALPGGYIYFSAADDTGIYWIVPWGILVFSLGITLFALPYLSIAEGTGHIQTVYSIKLVQNFLGACLIWSFVYQGGATWAATCMASAAAAIQLGWIFLTGQLKPVRHGFTSIKASFSWYHEIWPLQWRVGISALSGYLMTQIATPLLFITFSASEAGKMGLSLAIVNMIGLIAFSGVTKAAPLYPKLIHNAQWALMDLTLKRSLIFMCVLFTSGGGAILVIVFALQWSSYSDHFLSVGTLTLLFIAIFINLVHGALASNLRAYGTEPLLSISIVSAAMIVILSVFISETYGARGIVYSMFFVQLLFVLPTSIFVWKNTNKKLRVFYV